MSTFKLRIINGKLLQLFKQYKYLVFYSSFRHYIDTDESGVTVLVHTVLYNMYNCL